MVHLIVDEVNHKVIVYHIVKQKAIQKKYDENVSGEEVM
jgi:hypothetical protein